MRRRLELVLLLAAVLLLLEEALRFAPLAFFAVLERLTADDLRALVALRAAGLRAVALLRAVVALRAAVDLRAVDLAAVEALRAVDLRAVDLAAVEVLRAVDLLAVVAALRAVVLRAVATLRAPVADLVAATFLLAPVALRLAAVVAFRVDVVVFVFPKASKPLLFDATALDVDFERELLFLWAPDFVKALAKTPFDAPLDLDVDLVDNLVIVTSIKIKQVFTKPIIVGFAHFLWAMQYGGSDILSIV